VVEVLAGSEELPRGVELVDLGELQVMPGLVNPLTAMSPRSYSGSRTGVAGVSGGQNPTDARKKTAASAVKTEERFHRRVGSVGYAAFGWLPDASGFLAGQAAVLRPALEDEKAGTSLILKEPAFLLMSFELGKSWREVAERELKKAADAIVKEREKAENKAKGGGKPGEGSAPAKKGQDEKTQQGGGSASAPAPQSGGGAQSAQQGSQPQKPPAPPDPLVLAMRGELPIFLRVRSPAALDHFLRLFDRLPVKPKLVLVTSDLPPETVAKVLSRGDILRAFVLEPRVTEVWETSVLSSTARLLREAGREVAFVPLSDSLSGHEEILLYLAESVRCGLSEADALAGVTTVPARLLGLEGRVGVLRPGASASFSVYDGDPLSGTARLRRVFVDGVQVFREEPGTLSVSGVAVR
jgi:hypothetical protein